MTKLSSANIRQVSSRLLYPWGDDIEPVLGMIAALGVSNNKIIFKQCKNLDVQIIIGVIVEILKEGEVVKEVGVDVPSHIFVTTFYDHEYRYPVHANLCVKDGKLTTHYYDDVPIIVGIVIEPPSANNPELKFLWTYF